MGAVSRPSGTKSVMTFSLYFPCVEIEIPDATHDLPNDREAETGPFGFGSIKRFENCFQLIAGDTSSLVSDVNDEINSSLRGGGDPAAMIFGLYRLHIFCA